MNLITSNRWVVIVFLAACSLLSTTVLAQNGNAEFTQSHFLRLQAGADDEPIALQVAVVNYAPASAAATALSVDLISAIHIADKSYYLKLNQLFEQYDAVLFELVTSDSDNLPGNGEAGFNFLSMIQGWMKSSLGLSFQLEEVDYTLDNMVHADMTTSEFRASMSARGESMFSMFMQLWRAGMQQSLQRTPSSSDLDIFRAFFANNREQALKRVAAREFIDMEQFDAIMAAGDGSTLVTERNKKALRVLGDQIAAGKRKIGIFYGAAHMPDMEQRLMDGFGLMPQSTIWLDAWDLQE